MAARAEYSSRISEKASRPPLVESFEIRGLYGYRTIGLSSAHSATVLIAKNGTGKTTLLGALDAFLRLQLARLRNLKFDEIVCKLSSAAEPLVVTRAQVDEFLQVPLEGDLVQIAARTGLEPPVLFRFLIEDWAPATHFDWDSDNKVQSALMSAYAYASKDVADVCNKLQKSLFQRNPALANVEERVRNALEDFEIVYLPTYRRVELALTDEPGPSRFARRRRRPRFTTAAGSLFTPEIQFGLSDISDRLETLNERIIVESNNGYREISANIINELIEGALQVDGGPSSDIPSREDLTLFFSRLKDARSRMGPYPPVTVPDLEKLYAGDVPENSREFLAFFLSKLNTVIKATKASEAPVDDFIASCNKYLLSEDPSVNFEAAPPKRGISLDRKQLVLDRLHLSVGVESVPAGRRISLDALSSGEKQMISLFAKLFLYPKKKLVLIDEPELSLSIDWQSNILVDVLNAPLCQQIVAITHSPFVFDNELEPFAKPLDVIVDLARLEAVGSQQDDADDDE